MDASVQLHMETMFLCVPLRLGVMISSLGTFFTSMLYIWDLSHFQDMFRHWSGGYQLKTRLIIGAVTWAGAVFGLIGFLGTWYVMRDRIVAFNVYQFVRLLTWLYAFVYDLPLLRTCEFWVNDIKRMVEEHGWNPVMYDIAMRADCPVERSSFIVHCILGMVICMYVTWCTLRYTDILAGMPKHLLRAPKDLASGAYYAHSHGERTYINGMYGTEPGLPARAMV